MAVAAAGKYKSIEIDTGDHTPIGEDEVVFVLRARDGISVETLHAYREFAVKAGSPPEHIDAVDTSIREFEEWQLNNAVKIPD